MTIHSLTLTGELACLNADFLSGCVSLTALVLPDSVKRIERVAFDDCPALKELTLSRGLTEIPDSAMEGCSSLDSFTVPEYVTSLGCRFFPSATHAIYYRGVAPQYDAYAYANARSDLTSYVWRPAADQELFAHWTPCRYTIRYHANNGTSATIDQPFFYGDTVTLLTDAFSCPGCSFAGWALSTDEDAVYGDGQAVVNLTTAKGATVVLYAV